MQKTRRSVLANGAVIQQARRAKGWRTDDLARKAGYSKRTIENAESGKRVDMSTVADIATALGIEYASLLPSEFDDVPNIVRFQFRLEADARQIESSPHLKSFLALLQQMTQSDGPVRLKAVREGSAILYLEMQEDGFLRLVSLFPEFHERAREAIARMPEGKAFFRGEEQPRGLEVEGLLEIVESVRELRLRTVEYDEPPQDDKPSPPAITDHQSVTDETTGAEQNDEYLSYLNHLRDTVGLDATWATFDALREEARALPSPQREERLRAILSRFAEVYGALQDRGIDMP